MARARVHTASGGRAGPSVKSWPVAAKRKQQPNASVAASAFLVHAHGSIGGMASTFLHFPFAIEVMLSTLKSTLYYFQHIARRPGTFSGVIDENHALHPSGPRLSRNVLPGSSPPSSLLSKASRISRCVTDAAPSPRSIPLKQSSRKIPPAKGS